MTTKLSPNIAVSIVYAFSRKRSSSDITMAQRNGALARRSTESRFNALLLFRAISLLILLLVTVLSVGCIDLQAGQTLAKNGAALSRQARDTLQSTNSSISDYLDADTIVSKISTIPQNPVSEDSKASLSRISASLAIRAQLLDNLAKCYDSLGLLASYDAAGQVERSINDVTDSVNALADKLGDKSPPISKVSGEISSISLGAVAHFAQMQQLKTASGLLKLRTKRAQELLAIERQRLDSLRETISSTRGQAAIELVRIGVGTSDYSVLQKDLVAFGFIYSADQAAKVAATNSKLQEALHDIAVRHIADHVTLDKQSLDATIVGLAALVAEHEKLEKGMPLDMATVGAIIAQLQAYADQLAKTMPVDKKVSN